MSMLILFVIMSSSCEGRRCDTGRMMDIINSQLIKDNRNMNEYYIGEISNNGDYTYVSLYLRTSHLYHRYYKFSRKECKIVDLRIDQ